MNNRNKRSNPESGLYHAILQLRDLNECYDFFTDLCTAGEPAVTVMVPVRAGQ